jgi:integrase
MARRVGKLTALKVGRALPAGMYADGAGLYLQVTGTGAKSWIYRYSIRGKAREMGLGSLSAVSVADARTRAAACRALRQDGVDPIEARKADRAQAALDDAKAITFKEAAQRYIAAHRAGWKNPKHAPLWENTLAAYAEPVIGKISVQAVDTGLVLKVLEPIWRIKPETAGRVRGRIEVILDWAKSRGLRQGENPARWRGHLQYQLPARSKVRRVKHHPALPYAELPGFMAELREQEGVGARALEFTVLTAARTGEIIGAKGNEANTAEKLWTVPAERMKAGKEHRVPLSGRALTILRDVTALQTGDDAFIFGRGKLGKPLSNMTMAAVLRRMGYANVTVHGFRSTFRDWAAERTNFPNEVVEMALAHAVSNRVEAAYRRGDLFEKRRRLMAEWSTFCNTPTAASATVSFHHAVTSEPRSAGSVA